MAAAPAQSPLRRWKRFFGAFDSVDAAIVASDPALSRNEFRQIRGDVVELLCDCDADDHRAEQFCLVLDDMMAESLETLKLVPATPAVLATADLAKSVEALRKPRVGARSRPRRPRHRRVVRSERPCQGQGAGDAAEGDRQAASVHRGTD
jgi:hypothetical protein